ncbi:MAG: branched-chain amino acid ABC transporter permease [Anaerolineales bacterium]|jgi:branched-chain amino acid transport system permease protein|nr:MAG: branched-chain amino acid ABC transporter permease [Anaerolineales bacterium]
MPNVPPTARRVTTYKIIQGIIGVVFSAYLIWRLLVITILNPTYGPDTWARFAIAGLVLGSVYALIAVGYTLVYGILRMINFAHGDIMMIGAFGGYFVFEALKNVPAPTPADPNLTFLNAHPTLSVIAAFLVGMFVAALGGYFLEKIAYRPLRGAPRLVPLISAIGASIFLENAGQLMFGTQRRDYFNPAVLTRGEGWGIPIGESTVILTYTGVLTVIVSTVIMILLYALVMRTRLGRAMRAVSENKQVATLMGINVDGVISNTFIIGGALAGAAGVMWGIHLGLVYYFVGFIPGIKAFTAAVLGGIGNIPGAMLGGMFLGIVESVGPAVLGINFQLKDVIAFGILVLVLIFRPTGIMGEVLTEEKV